MGEVNSFLEDIGNCDELGVLNGFRTICEAVVKQVVSEGKWFTVCHKVDKEQVDIMSIENDSGKKLGAFLHDVFDVCCYRTAVYKYLVMNYLCYVEVPGKSFKTDTGSFKQTFTKMLITANETVMAKWLGVELEDLNDKYVNRVFSISMNDGDDYVSYVKLTESKQGTRSISVPRADLDVSVRGTRIIPLFMLKEGVDELYNKMSSSFVKVSFLKDNSQKREITTTLDMSKISELYGSCLFTDDAIESSYEGDFLNNKYLSRGYIRVPEIGGCKFNEGTKSLSYARIYNIEFDAEPDLTYIDIDLSTVQAGFEEGVLSYPSKSQDIIDMLGEFGLDTSGWVDTIESKKRYISKDSSSLLQWFEDNNMLYSTVFLRDVCMFMLANPQWFTNFDGKPKRYSTVANLGIE